jgi:hypothetical protein
MSEEKSSQCSPPLVHCFLNSRFECECGAERHDEVLAEMILAVTTVKSVPASPGAWRHALGAWRHARGALRAYDQERRNEVFCQRLRGGSSSRCDRVRRPRA